MRRVGSRWGRTGTASATPPTWSLPASFSTKPPRPEPNASCTRPPSTHWPRERRASRRTSRRRGISSASIRTTSRTKRQAEQLVLRGEPPTFLHDRPLSGNGSGPRDTKPTSTAIAKAYSRAIVAIVPPGGIPIIDVELLALAHRRALVCGRGGERYAVVGPYLSYGDLAALVASLTGRPRWLIPLPDRLQTAIVSVAGWSGPLARRWWPDVSRQLAAAGFLRLHVRGDRANACFGLDAPPSGRLDRQELVKACLPGLRFRGRFFFASP